MRATGRSAQTCPLPGVDPDDTYNETPYEKGFCFVSYLAHLVGDQDRFDAFLKVPSPRMGEKGQGGGTRLEEARGTEESPLWGLGQLRRPPSSQAYVSEFKFQSILADDFLEFYLEYFPELKQKGVDSIPGERDAGLRLLHPGRPAGGSGEQTQAPGSSHRRSPLSPPTWTAAHTLRPTGGSSGRSTVASRRVGAKGRPSAAWEWGLSHHG